MVIGLLGTTGVEVIIFVYLQSEDAAKSENVILGVRACLKKAFCKMCVTICGIFCPDEGAVAGYGTEFG